MACFSVSNSSSAGWQCNRSGQSWRRWSLLLQVSISQQLYSLLVYWLPSTSITLACHLQNDLCCVGWGVKLHSLNAVVLEAGCAKGACYSATRVCVVRVFRRQFSRRVPSVLGFRRRPPGCHRRRRCSRGWRRRRVQNKDGSSLGRRTDTCVTVVNCSPSTTTTKISDRPFVRPSVCSSWTACHNWQSFIDWSHRLRYCKYAYDFVRLSRDLLYPRRVGDSVETHRGR